MNDSDFDRPHAVITVDDHGKIVELDHAAEEVLGLGRSEALGREIAELIVPGRVGSDYWIRVRGPSSPESPRRFNRRPSPVEPPGDAGRARVEVAPGRTGASALQVLLECGEELGQTGSWDWHLETDELIWSDNLYRLYGLEPGAITPTPADAMERAHPGDRGRIEREVELNRAGRVRPLDFRIVRPDGVVRHLRASEAVIERADGRPRRIVGSVQDITDWYQAEHAIAAHMAVAEALVEWQTFEQGATDLLGKLAAALDCVAGVIWLPEGDVLVAHVIWRSGSIDVSKLESVIRQLRLPRGVGLAGQVWESGEPKNALSLDEDPRFPSEAVAGLRGAVALPAIHAQEVLAVLEFCCEPVSVDVTDRVLRSLTGIGYELGQFLAHRRGELKPLALTPRELEVLQLAAQGCGGREIAERLVLSPATVRTHFERIYQKYGVSDRAAAVAKALREGLIQ